jgi:hypothetical protein
MQHSLRLWFGAAALLATNLLIPVAAVSAAPLAERRLPAPGCDARYRFPNLSSAPGAGAGYDAPRVTVSCARGELTVVSNGMIAYEFVARTPNGLRAQNFTWKVPTSPKIAARTTSLVNQLGTLAFTVTGIPIYGPTEGPVPPQSAFGDPVYNGLLDSCQGHTGFNADYHYHAILADARCYLNESVVGWAMDGFPIYSNPGWKWKSGFARTGDPRSNSWSAYTYVGGAANSLDACNGRRMPNGSYRYYVTEAFPYVIGCYAGTPTVQRGAAAAPMQMPPASGIPPSAPGGRRPPSGGPNPDAAPPPPVIAWFCELPAREPSS